MLYIYIYASYRSGEVLQLVCIYIYIIIKKISRSRRRQKKRWKDGYRSGWEWGSELFWRQKWGGGKQQVKKKAKVWDDVSTFFFFHGSPTHAWLHGPLLLFVLCFCRLLLLLLFVLGLSVARNKWSSTHCWLIALLGSSDRTICRNSFGKLIQIQIYSYLPQLPTNIVIVWSFHEQIHVIQFLT